MHFFPQLTNSLLFVLYLCLRLRLSVSPSLCLSVSVCLSISLSVSVSVSLYRCISLSRSIAISLYLCLSQSPTIKSAAETLVACHSQVVFYLTPWKLIPHFYASCIVLSRIVLSCIATLPYFIGSLNFQKECMGHLVLANLHETVDVIFMVNCDNYYYSLFTTTSHWTA